MYWRKVASECNRILETAKFEDQTLTFAAEELTQQRLHGQSARDERKYYKRRVCIRSWRRKRKAKLKKTLYTATGAASLAPCCFIDSSSPIIQDFWYYQRFTSSIAPIQPKGEKYFLQDETAQAKNLKKNDYKQRRIRCSSLSSLLTTDLASLSAKHRLYGTNPFVHLPEPAFSSKNDVSHGLDEA